MAVVEPSSHEVEPLSHGAWSFQIGPTYMTYQGGFVLRGEKKVKHGEGIMRWEDGREYKGEFSFNEMHGMGTMQWPTGEKYDGQYYNGLKSGLGKFSWPDGWSLEGSWKEGQPDGEMVYINQDGGFYIEYKSGQVLSTKSIPLFASFDGWILKPDYDVFVKSDGPTISEIGEGDKEAEESEPTCCVCLATMCKGETCCTTSCGHVFHKECIDSWVRVKSQCPLCLHKIPLYREFSDEHEHSSFSCL